MPKPLSLGLNTLAQPNLCLAALVKQLLTLVRHTQCKKIHRQTAVSSCLVYHRTKRQTAANLEDVLLVMCLRLDALDVELIVLPSASV
jgi:hypothetical protein